MKKNTFFEDDSQQNIKKWYEEYKKAESATTHKKSEVEVLDLKTEAKKCLDSESTAYHLKQSKSHNSEYSWLKTAFSKGTTSDKVAAGIVLVQNSPKHNLNHLTSLISLVKIAKHNQYSMVISSLKDLFLNDLLHPKFNLLKFEEQNLDELDNFNKSFEVDDDMNFKNRPTLSRNKLLAIWYFEDQLKETYERFVTSLAAIASDTVDTNREKAIVILNDLLMGNLEQEHKLLNILINKIGDPSNKVASKAIFCLSKLLHEHPNMKLVVLCEVEKLLFRTNVATRAQYFAICLLTQFLLSKEDTEVATTLIDVYFAFFKACLKKGEPDSRMMAAVLAGVNRAYRFANVDSTKLNSHIDSVYKVVHVGSFNVSLNALSLLFQVVGKNPNQTDRFYSAFYKKLLDSQIGTANKRAMFLNLLFKALRNDQNILRFHAFVKRVLQVSLHYPANVTCAILYTLSQVLKSKKFSNKILTKSAGTDLEEHSEKDFDDTSVVKEEKKDKKKKSSIILSNVIVETPKEETKEEVTVEDVKIKTEFKATFYDPFSRNPLHSGANLSFYCELEALSKHFHPTVSLYANTIIQGKAIEYSGDPLQDLSLIRFLDRFAFKNPKKLESKKVSKKNDPLAQRAAYTPKGVRSIPVDSAAYLNESEDRIPTDELYLYKYLQKQKEIRGLTIKNEDEDDNESVNSEDFNDMLDNLSKNKDIDDLDIASDFKAAPKRKRDGSESEDDQSDEISEDEDLEGDENISESEDENLELGEEDEYLQDLDDLDLDEVDDDLSDIEFNDDDDDDDNEFAVESSKKRKQKLNNKTNKKLKGFDENPFVSAEEFAEMLEKQGQMKFKHGASKALRNSDEASIKQLDWETERNQRISGFQGKKGKKFNNFKNKKNFSKYKKPMKRINV